MAPKIFVTGSTGYIGGDALSAIYAAHPDWDYTCLARNSDKGALVASQYPKVKLVYGDLDSAALLEEEAGKANVVCHFASADHEPAAHAIAKGLAAHPPFSPGYWIHTSGSGILVYPDLESSTYGESSSKIWDDIKNITDITSLPDHAPHRRIDKIVLAANSDMVRTAIVCPPTIYGRGRGPGNQSSMQLPGLTSSMLKRKEAFHVGAGKSLWSNVHVHDLSAVYLALAQAAVAGGGKASWGDDGYYFTENGEHCFGEVSKDIATKLHKRGLLENADVASVSADEANKLYGHGAVLWATNSRSRASRARRVLGWQPKGAALEATLDEVIDVEKAALA